MEKIVECVLNFSEGCKKEVITAIVDATKSSSSDVRILDVDPGMQTNRTVFTFAGQIGAVEEAAFWCIKKTAELIDMSQHKGVHPRQGCTDVCPFIPVANVTMQDCVDVAKRLGQRVAQEIGMPVYLYGYAASSEERANLAYLRKGEYEGLSEKLKTIKPDYGPSKFDKVIQKTGAVCIGARDFLIAYNVNLNTKDVTLANKIAKTIRESGRKEKDAAGNSVTIPGLLKAVKGIGWYIDEYGIAQLSFNLLNYHTTPLHVLFETCVEEANKLGVRVTGGEIVGLLPLEVLTTAGKYFLQKAKSPYGVCDGELINIAIKSMGLSEIKIFEAQEKIVEYKIFASQRKLGSMKLVDFVDAVGSNAPAPGGGSVAATAGALGIGLGMMVGALGIKKSEHKDPLSAMNKLYQAGEKITKYFEKMKLNIDLDTQAFDGILQAIRLPKDTDDNKKIRADKLQGAYKQATLIPLNVATDCVDALESLIKMASCGNPNAISDVGVGALMLYAGFAGASLNVEINLTSIKDKQFAKDVLAKLSKSQKEAVKYRDTILTQVKSIMRNE